MSMPTTPGRLGRRLLATALVPALAATGGGVAWSGVAESDPTGTVSMVSVASDESQAVLNSHISGTATVSSADGRYVVFSTAAPLVARDRNATEDVYRRDTVTGRTTLVSVTPDGRQGDDSSFEPTISADGRLVAFTAWSDGLVAADDNGVLDVLVKDVETGRLTLASRSTRGDQARRNSFAPVISGNGRVVAFQTFGRFSKVDEDRREDIYAHDLRTRRTQQMSVDDAGRDLPSNYLVGTISHDGTRVSFGNDNHAWVRDRAAGRTLLAWRERNHPSQPGPSGTLGRPMISGNGRYVVFSTMQSPAPEAEEDRIVDVFRVDLETGDYLLVSTAADGTGIEAHAFGPSVSRTGRYVGFTSAAGNLVAKDDNLRPDTFVKDLVTGSVAMASWGLNGPGNSDSGRANAVAIGPDGRHLVFESYANQLVDVDANRKLDVFVWVAD